MTFSIQDFFLDPILRSATWGSMLMCLTSGVIGVLVFIQRRSLLGEALSHAAYPGVVLSVVICSSLFPFAEEWVPWAILIGAFVFCLLGLWAIHALEIKLRMQSDTALCLVLSLFFGIGVLLVSRVQFTHAMWYRQIQVFLFGQAATMTDTHVWIYAVLFAVSVAVVLLLYPAIKVVHFDRSFAQSIGVPYNTVDIATFLLLAMAIVIGIRSVGVVLMSGMLIAPAVTARQCTHRLSRIFLIAGGIGLICGFAGNYLSVMIPQLFSIDGGGVRWSLPTGPVILLIGTTLCLFAIFFAPERGIFWRMMRIAKFRFQRLKENCLKFLWKQGKEKISSFSQIQTALGISTWALYWMLFDMMMRGWLDKRTSGYMLSEEGWKEAQKIIRLHRLWEVYLVDYLGQGREKVHSSAEEMEHILTPDLEKELSELLKNPKQDPHMQPIPQEEP